ncbi:ATP-dependent protease HslVU (ClpYQ) peptidase subunit [Cryobacterium psychrotolerans]|nr:ATP-dependent protease HslVU (ClpYQ) peptidase subunit [Cryobacterium psychrotolerans]
MKSPEPGQRLRRPHNELKTAIREYMRGLGGGTAATVELTAMLEEKFENVGKSTVRASMQDERYFERVSPGIFRLKPGA